MQIPVGNSELLKRGKISISPPVWRKVYCKSHFFVREGRNDWVKEIEFKKQEIKKFRRILIKICFVNKTL